MFWGRSTVKFGGASKGQCPTDLAKDILNSFRWYFHIQQTTGLISRNTYSVITFLIITKFCDRLWAFIDESFLKEMFGIHHSQFIWSADFLSVILQTYNRQTFPRRISSLAVEKEVKIIYVFDKLRDFSTVHLWVISCWLIDFLSGKQIETKTFKLGIDYYQWFCTHFQANALQFLRTYVEPFITLSNR